MQINPGDLVVDYSFNPPTVPELVAHGVKCACRYQPGAAGKGLTVAERDALLAAGVGILALWETTASRALSGAPGGTADGKAAATAWASVGYPAGLPIVPAWDFQVTSQSLALSEAYGRAFAANCAPYKLGVYGGSVIMAALADISVINWQSAATSWGVYPNPHMRQGLQVTLGSGIVDPNTVCIPFEAWGAAVQPVPTPDPPVPTPDPPQPQPTPPQPVPGPTGADMVPEIWYDANFVHNVLVVGNGQAFTFANNDAFAAARNAKPKFAERLVPTGVILALKTVGVIQN